MRKNEEKLSKATISGGRRTAGRMWRMAQAAVSAVLLLSTADAASGADVDEAETASAVDGADAAVDDGASKVCWKAAAFPEFPATRAGYGTNDCDENLNTWLWSGWSRDEMEIGTWPDCTIVLVTGVSDGDPSTRYP